MTLSNDLRQRVVQAYQAQEGSQRELARRFRVARSTIQRWLNAPSQSHDEPETRGRPPALNEQARQELRALWRQHRDATETEFAELLHQSGYPLVSRSCIGRALRSMDLTRKKNMARH